MGLDSVLINNSFTIFNITIYFYAICIVSGMVTAAVLGIPLFKRRGIQPDYIIDIMIAVIPCSIVCARLWYVILDLNEFHSFMDVIDIRSGGMAIHGGILGGALGLFIIAKIRHISMSRLCDCGAALLPIGQAIGRWGNFFNQEVYGIETNVKWFPFSVYIESTGSYHLALFFYEMILDFALFAFLYWFMFRYKGKRNLYCLSAYFIGYGIIRGVLEPLRIKEFQMGNFGIPTSVITSILLFIGGVAVLAYLLTKDIKEKNYWWKDTFSRKKPLEQSATLQSDAEAENLNSQNAEVVEKLKNCDSEQDIIEKTTDKKEENVSDKENKNA